MEKNPFKYGTLMTGASFCNRTTEKKRLTQAFNDGQNIILISPRRWGKSSLVEEVVENLSTDTIVIKIDCFGIRSEKEFYYLLLAEYLKASSTKIDELVKLTKKLINTLAPFISYSIGESEQIKIGINLGNQEPDLSQVLDLADKLAVSKNKKVVVCIDEFQKIADWNNHESIFEKLRGHWQKHKHVTYCLYGSKRSVMTTIFSNSSSPFYRFGETIFLKKIEQIEWISFIEKQFNKSKKKITAALAGKLTGLVDCHSYYTQYLSRLCWSLTPAGGKVTEKILSQAWEMFLNDHLIVFIQSVDKLTQYQVNYIKAFCDNVSQFTSQKVLKHYHLGSVGNISRIEKSLEDSEIIDYLDEKPFFIDPYFKPLFLKKFNIE